MQNNNIHDGFGEYAVTHQVKINIALVACREVSVAYTYIYRHLFNSPQFSQLIFLFYSITALQLCTN